MTKTQAGRDTGRGKGRASGSGGSKRAASVRFVWLQEYLRAVSQSARQEVEWGNNDERLLLLQTAFLFTFHFSLFSFVLSPTESVEDAIWNSVAAVTAPV